MRCSHELDELALGHSTCRACGIVHVTPDAIVELLRAAAPDIRLRTGGVMAFPRGAHAPQQLCPDCNDAMIAGVLFEEPVDQCAVHGVWFADADALARVLENARRRFEERRKSS
jgi:hypothetical protein